MSTTPFFRLPIISFIVTFCILFAQLIIKLNELNAQNINYHYSPDFMRIIGMSLLMMLSISICLNSIKIYRFSLRNIIFVSITSTLALLLSYWIDIQLSDFFASIFDLTTKNGYTEFVFWLPIVSRVCIILIVFLSVAIMAYIVKFRLFWSDETINVDLVLNSTAKQIQIIYFVVGYLAVNFIFQRYLYIAVYMYLGNGHLPELYNFLFYLSSIMIAVLSLIYLKQKEGGNYFIDAKIVCKTVGLIVLSQLMISIIVSFVTIYLVQYYFSQTVPYGDMERYNHNIALFYSMLNSIFVVAILTCLLSYIVSRFWFKQNHYLGYLR